MKLGKLDRYTYFILTKNGQTKSHKIALYWKISGGLKVSLGKEGCLFICNTGSALTGFIPENKLVFRSKKSTSTSDYHCEINADTFRKWFVVDLLPYLP